MTNKYIIYIISKKYKFAIIFCDSLIGLQGCAKTQHIATDAAIGSLTGAALGAALGAGIGALAGGGGGATKGAIIGAKAGAGVGATAGIIYAFAQDEFTQTALKNTDTWKIFPMAKTEILRETEITNKYDEKKYIKVDVTQITLPLTQIAHKSGINKWKLEPTIKDKLIMVVNSLQKANGKVLVFYPEESSIPKNIIEEILETGALAYQDSSLMGVITIRLIRNKPEQQDIGEDEFTQNAVKNANNWEIFSMAETKIIRVTEITNKYDEKKYKQVDEMQITLPLIQIVHKTGINKWKLEPTIKMQLIMAVKSSEKANGKVLVFYPEEAVPKNIIEEILETGALASQDSSLVGVITIRLIRNKPEKQDIGEPAGTQGELFIPMHWPQFERQTISSSFQHGYPNSSFMVANMSSTKAID